MMIVRTSARRQHAPAQPPPHAPSSPTLHLPTPPIFSLFYIPSMPPPHASSNKEARTRHLSPLVGHNPSTPTPHTALAVHLLALGLLPVIVTEHCPSTHAPPVHGQLITASLPASLWHRPSTPLPPLLLTTTAPGQPLPSTSSSITHTAPASCQWGTVPPQLMMTTRWSWR